MSSEKTTNLQLNKWVPTDYVKMDEFNENFDKIDEVAADHAALLADNTNKIGILNKKTEGIVNVKEFGVKGDGVTDDTSAIQSIVNNYAGNTIVFPDANYVFGNITVPSDTEIIISRKATLKLKDGTNNPIFKGSGVTNIKISGGVFDGNKENNATAQQLFSFENCDTVTIKDMEIKNTTRHGIVTIDTSNVKILNVKGDNIFGSGILIVPSTKDVDNVLVRDCVLKNVAQETSCYGVYFNSGDIYIVKNSTIENVTVDGAYYGGIFPGGDNNQVINCTAKNCANWRGMWIHDSRNIKVIGGNYSNNGRDGIYVQKSHDVEIIAPTCEHNANNGLGIDSDNTAAGRLRGTNTNKSVRVLGGVYRNNSQSSSATYSGIRIGAISGGMVDVTIVGTLCIDDQSTPTQKRGIDSIGSGSGHIIVGNTSRGSVQEGIYVPDAVILSGNTVNGQSSKYNKPTFVGSSISAAPSAVGQIAIVGGVAYIAVGTSAATDWKQIS